MPYNILLLPLLAGYLFLSKSRLRAYATARLPKDQLLLAAAVHGFIFLVASRVICYLLLQTSYGSALGTALRKIAPFDFIGTALGTLMVATVLIVCSNAVVSERVAGFWLYHRGDLDPMTRVLWSSSVGAEPNRPSGPFLFTLMLIKEMAAFIGKEMGTFLSAPVKELPELLALVRSRDLEFSKLKHGQSRTVMINTRDGKVLVGYVVDLPTTNPSLDFVTITPLWSGYRDVSNRVLKSVDYSEAIARVSQKNDTEDDPADFARVVRSADIASASIFNVGAFAIQDAHDATQLPDVSSTKKGFWASLWQSFLRDQLQGKQG